MAFRKRVVTISDSLIEKGNWYQPYLHSVPKNFNKAQSSYYSSFSLKEARNKLLSQVKGLTQQLISYYDKREEEIGQYMFGKKASKKEIEANLKIFVTEFADAYAKNRAKNFPFIDSIANSLTKIQKVEKKVSGDAAFTKSVIENMAKKAVKKMKLKDPKKQERKVKALTTIIYEIQNFLIAVLKKYKVENPNELVGELMDLLLKGKSIKGRFKKLVEVQGILDKEVALLVKIIEAIEKGVLTKENSALRTSAIGNEIAKAFGILNEDIVTDTAENMANDVIQRLTKGTVKVIQVEGTGQKDVAADVADGQMTIQKNNAEPMKIGIDVKYIYNRSGNMRRYSRGWNKKKVSEVFQYMPKKDLNTMIYLLANSYFFKSDAERDWYGELMNTRSEYSIPGLLATFSALYAALPAKFGSSSKEGVSLRSLKSEIKTDTRTIVAIDSEFILMTSFLNKIRGDIIKGGRKGKNNLKGYDVFIKEVLDGWNTKANGIKGKSSGLYKDKIDKLMTSKQLKTRKGYSVLKQHVTNKITSRDLIDWTYSAKTTFDLREDK